MLLFKTRNKLQPLLVAHTTFLEISCHGLLYPPQTLFVVGILFSRCPCVCASLRACVRPCVRASVRNVLFFNIMKSHCWIFIKPCKHVHICKTNTLDKKVRARGQILLELFPFVVLNGF